MIIHRRWFKLNVKHDFNNCIAKPDNWLPSILIVTLHNTYKVLSTIHGLWTVCFKVITDIFELTLRMKEDQESGWNRRI